MNGEIKTRKTGDDVWALTIDGILIGAVRKVVRDAPVAARGGTHVAGYRRTTRYFVALNTGMFTGRLANDDAASRTLTEAREMAATMIRNAELA